MVGKTCSAWALLFTCLAGTPLLTSSTDVQPIIDLGYSQYQGKTLGSGVNQFLGIRYASSPVGNLRFRAPVSPAATGGVQDATAFGPICLGINTRVPSHTQSEDCLFANVWAPANATSESKLPVWVYIQGGGYVSNSNANYNGSTVVANSGQNIVFVNFNYRVSSWGFLAGEKVRRNGDLNAGLLDQRRLLEWVQKYIHEFGGDPKHVVIHGVSAGAGSVALQLAAYGGRDDNLFTGAIIESPFFPTQSKPSDLEWQFDRYSNAVGCGNYSDTLSCLRSKDTATLQAANIPSPYPGRSKAPLFYWTPTIDGNLIQDRPYDMYEKGDFIRVPLLIGDDTNEGSNFAANASSAAEISSFFQDNYPRLSSVETNGINAQYPLMSPLPKHAPYFPSSSAAYGDSTFTCPGDFLSSMLSSPPHSSTHQTYQTQSNKVFTYLFNVLSTPNILAGLGVPHTFESPTIFGPGNVNDNLNTSSFVTYNSAIVPIVMNYFISFVRTLDVNVHKYAEAPRWEEWNGGERLVIQVKGNGTAGTQMERVGREEKERCAFWRGIAGVMGH